MGTEKKCYKCLAEVNGNVKTCPRCRAKLGARTASGIAAKPGSPLLNIFFALFAFALIGKFALQSRTADAKTAPAVDISSGLVTARDGAIRKIKEKGAEELQTVGISDVGYKDDTLCVHVDQRFASLSADQQRQVVALMAGEWRTAIGKTTTAVKILEAGTGSTLAEFTI